MKDIPIKRILRYAFAVFIVLTISAYSNPANAESGSLEIFAENVSEYHPVNSVSGKTPLFTSLAINNTQFNRINSVYVNYSGKFVFNGMESDSTPFVVATGALTSCSGFVSYSRSSGAINYIFSGGCDINANTITLTLTNTSFFNNVGTSDTPVNWRANTVAPTVVNPVYIKTTDGNYLVANGDMWYIASLVTNVTNYYDVSYSGNIATVDITKTGAIVSTKVNISNSTALKLYETTFNTNGYSTSFTYDTGIALNMTDQQGNYDFVVVNSTNSTFPSTPTQGSGGSPSGQINYNYNSATIGQTYGVNASITTANYSAANTYYIHAYDSSNNIISGFPISFSTQNYNSSKFWSFNTQGPYHTNLSYCGHTVFDIPDVLCTSGITSKTFLDTASVYIAPVTYAYSITTDKNSYLPGETIIYTINNPSPNKIYMDVFEDNINIGFGVTELGLNIEIPAGVSGYTTSRTIPDNLPKGNYTAYLISAKLSEASFEIFDSTEFNITTPSSTSNTLFLGWDRSTYTLGDSGKLTTVSDYNSTTVYVVSPGGANKTYLFPLNSTNNTIISFNEVGIWKATLINNTDYKLYSNVSVFAGSPIGNETFANCLFSANYVCWDNTQYEQGDPYTISFRLEITTLTTYNPYIVIINPNGKNIENISINGSYDSATNTYVGSASGSFTPQATTGIYYARLMPDQLGREGARTSSAATVIARVSSVPTTAGETTSTNLLNSGFFAALLIMIVFVGIGMEIGGGMGAIVGFGGGFIMSAIYDLVPTWSIYLFAILVLTAFAVMVGSKVTGGGNGGGD